MAPHFRKLSVEDLVLQNKRLFVRVDFNVLSNHADISTGGGASLELLEGKKLPGIAALTDKRP